MSAVGKEKGPMVLLAFTHPTQITPTSQNELMVFQIGNLIGN